MERIAILAGSFDPFTRGHEALVDEALRIFDRLIVGIGNNVSKRSLLSVDARRRMIEDLYRGEPRVEVRVYDGLTTDLARQTGAVALVRGVRNTVDFEFERTMEAANRRIAPELTTVMLVTPAEVADIASSTVRELLAFGHDVRPLLPEGIKIENYLNNE